MNELKQQIEESLEEAIMANYDYKAKELTMILSLFDVEVNEEIINWIRKDIEKKRPRIS